jgi:IS5 family transposase
MKQISSTPCPAAQFLCGCFPRLRCRIDQALGGLPPELSPRLKSFFTNATAATTPMMMNFFAARMKIQNPFSNPNFAAASAPPATPLLKFRRLLETHDLCKGLLAAINADLTACGLLLREGTLVDATLVAAPPSTKNQDKKRDPEMHQNRNLQTWLYSAFP